MAFLARVRSVTRPLLAPHFSAISARQIGLRIIDSEQLVVPMGGSPFSVGAFPHTVRKNLMKSHVHSSDESKIPHISHPTN
jgi:hypothetical protein